MGYKPGTAGTQQGVPALQGLLVQLFRRCRGDCCCCCNICKKESLAAPSGGALLRYLHTGGNNRPAIKVFTLLSCESLPRTWWLLRRSPQPQQTAALAAPGASLQCSSSVH